jgi:hypothetical protein
MRCGVTEMEDICFMERPTETWYVDRRHGPDVVQARHVKGRGNLK